MGLHDMTEQLNWTEFSAEAMGLFQFSLLSCVQLFATPWTTAQRQAFLCITNSWSLLKLMFIKSVMPSDHLILCHPLLLLPPIFPRSGSFPLKRLFLNWIFPISPFLYWIFNCMCLHYIVATLKDYNTKFFTSGGQILELQLQHQSFQWILRTDFL